MDPHGRRLKKKKKLACFDKQKAAYNITKWE
jgi:hypothetical protein